MSPSTNTRFGHTISTEATTSNASPHPFMSQTEVVNSIDNTIKDLLSNFDDHDTKDDEHFKEIIEDTILEKRKDLMQNLKMIFRPSYFISNNILPSFYQD